MTGPIIGMIAGALGVIISIQSGNYNEAGWAFTSLVWAFAACVNYYKNN